MERGSARRGGGAMPMAGVAGIICDAAQPQARVRRRQCECWLCVLRRPRRSADVGVRKWIGFVQLGQFHLPPSVAQPRSSFKPCNHGEVVKVHQCGGTEVGCIPFSATDVEFLRACATIGCSAYAHGNLFSSPYSSFLTYATLIFWVVIIP